MQRPRIAYITLADPNDRHSWSGTNFYILQQLRKHIGDVDTLGPAEPAFEGFICKAINFLSLTIFGKRFDYRHTPFYAKACARLFEKKMRGIKYDLIICPGNPASIAYMRTSIPIVYIGDRTVAASLNYHEIFKNLWKWSEKKSLHTEKIAFEKARLICFPSAWAAYSAIKDYDIDELKVKVIPFGANFDENPPADVAAQKKKNSVCQLLFIGVDWEGKGGPIAVSCLEELLKRGVESHLTVVGCKVPDQYKEPHITNHPFLNKNVPAQAETLRSLFATSDFFILPTRVEAYGLVFCESAAYGIPSLGTDTGGVSGALHEGLNGFLMPYQAGGKEYAEKIAEIFSSDEKYYSLVKSARKLFEERLNWDAFIKTLREALVEKRIIS